MADELTSARMVERAIRSFLNSDKAEVLCLSGAWGIGKTWLWNNLLLKAQAEKKIALRSYSYVSLFGVQSIDELKTSIFENTTSTESMIQEPSLDTFNDNLTQALAPAGRKVLSGIVETFFKSAAGGVKALSHFSVRSTLICLDDLERKGEKLRIVDILGLASQLSERRNCKIIIILNTEQLLGIDKESFDRYREKVIDQSLTYAPTSEDCARIAISKPDDIDRELLTRLLSINVLNIRVIQKIQRLLDQIKPLVRNYHAQVSNQIVATLALLGWLHFSRTSDEISGLMDFTINRRGQIEFDEKKTLTNDEIHWNNFLERYGYNNTDELDLLLLEGIRAGFFNTTQISNIAARLDAKARDMDSNLRLEQAWSIFHNSLADNADTVVKTIFTAFKENLQVANMTNLDATVRTFKELGKHKEAQEAISYFIENKQGGPKAFDLSSFAFRHHVTDPDVRSALAARSIAGRIPPSPDDVLKRLADSNSWSIVDVEVLSKLTVDEFVAVLKRVGGDVLRDTMDSLRSIEGSNLSDPRYATISKTFRLALTSLAQSSKINEIRLRTFGFIVTKEAEEDAKD